MMPTTKQRFLMAIPMILLAGCSKAESENNPERTPVDQLARAIPAGQSNYTLASGTLIDATTDHRDHQLAARSRGRGVHGGRGK